MSAPPPLEDLLRRARALQEVARAKQHARIPREEEEKEEMLSSWSRVKEAASREEYLDELGRTGIVVVAAGVVRVAENAQQDERDFGRDALLVKVGGTSFVFKGASVGYQGAVESIVQRIRAVIRAAPLFEDAVFSPTQEEVMARFARTLLHCINRTRSGGETYEAIDKCLRCEAFAIITPDSVAAKPLEIELSLGPFKRFSKQGDAFWDYGVRANLRATSFYRLTDLDPSDELSPHFAKVMGTFTQTLALSVPVLRFQLASRKEDPYGVEQFLVLPEGDIVHGSEGAIRLELSLLQKESEDVT